MGTGDSRLEPRKIYVYYSPDSRSRDICIYTLDVFPNGIRVKDIIQRIVEKYSKPDFGRSFHLYIPGIYHLSPQDHGYDYLGNDDVIRCGCVYFRQNPGP
jgi:hypothetical protein